MKKTNSGISLLLILILILSTGCNRSDNEKSSEPEQSIISGIHTSMTSEEVFAIVGKDYDNSQTEENYKNTIEYDYCIDSDKVFDTQMKWYMFVEFDSQTGTLRTFGYHLGHNGDFIDPSYTYSEEELKEVYEKIKI